MSRLMAATIRGGVAVSEDFADLPDGTRVSVVLDADDDGVEISPELEAALIAAAEESDRGVPGFTWEQVCQHLDERRAARRG